MITNNKPIIQKIPLTDEDKAYIKSILEGGPKRETVANLKEKGWDVDSWLKRRQRTSINNRMIIIKKTFNLGECQICRGISEYKIIQKVPDASVISWYCSEHLPSEF
jgi:hypothetical protein